MNVARRRKIIILSAGYLLLQESQQKKRKKRRWWMTALFRKRAEFSASHLLRELSSEDSGHFDNFTRMSITDFEKLLQLIEPKIQKQSTHFRETIPARERLSVTLRFLATGDSYRSLSYTFRFSKQVISTIIPEVCRALIEALKEEIKVQYITFLLIFFFLNWWST